MSTRALSSPRALHVLSTLLNLSAIGGAAWLLRSHHVYNLEEHEARMDELEGTLRGHIGYIEDALDRIEGKGGKGGEKMNKLYEARGRDEKKGKEKE